MLTTRKTLFIYLDQISIRILLARGQSTGQVCTTPSTPSLPEHRGSFFVVSHQYHTGTSHQMIEVNMLPYQKIMAMDVFT